MFRLYDTRSGKKRPFRPLRGNLVRIYTCGPSVYNYSHIGNFRTYIVEDVLVRYLRYMGYRVKRVMNITDVEDKAIAAARKEGVTLESLERDKIKAFFSDYDALGMIRPDVVARASRHIPQMVKLIMRLCRRGCCIRERDGVYFNVRRFRAYGALARLRTRTYFGRANGDDYAKEGLWDFRLWKRWSRGDRAVGWESPLGFGRPGWHIECSAMSMHYLGESFDIHCGGTDNIYPHHENEIAQSEGATGKRLANFWFHAKHLTVGRKKMSKRTGNVLYVSALRKAGIRPRCLRYFLLSESYWRPHDFTMAEFRKRICLCGRIRKHIKRLKRLQRPGDGKRGEDIARRLLMGFERAMDDNLDTRSAFGGIEGASLAIEQDLGEGKLTAKDAKAILLAFGKIDSVLGVF